MKRLLFFSILFVNVSLSFSQVIWRHIMPYSSLSSIVQYLEVGPSNSVTLAGEYTVRLDSGDSEFVTYGYGIFIQQRDGLGNLLWSDFSVGKVSLSGMTFDGSHFFLTGGFSSDTLSLTSTTLYKPAGAINSSFLIKYDLNGNVVLVLQDIPGLGKIKVAGNYLYAYGGKQLSKFDLAGNLIWTKSAAKYNIHALVISSDQLYLKVGNGASYDMDSVKAYDTSGVLKWEYEIPGYGYPDGITSDANGDCYFSGENPGSGNFIAKLDSSGNLLWTEYSYPHSVAYLFPNKTSSGFFSGGRDAAGSGFLDAYDLLGNCTSSISVHNDVITCMDYNDDVYYAGGHDSEVSPQLGFVAKMGVALATSADQASSQTLIEVYPSPSSGVVSVKYFSMASKHFYLKIYSPAGKLIYNDHVANFQGQYNKSIDLSGYAKGIYSVEILAGKKKESRKVVLQ